jgi:hypothetical protein
MNTIKKYRGLLYDCEEVELKVKKQNICECDVVHMHHVTRHNTPIHNILSTAAQLSISQKALGMVPEDGNVMPKHVGATIHN